MYLPHSLHWVNLTVTVLTLPSPQSSGPWFSPDIHWQCRQLCCSRIWRRLWSWSRSPALHRSAWEHESFQHLHGVGETGQTWLLSILHIYSRQNPSIVFIFQFHAPRIHLPTARRARSTVTTSSLFMVSPVSDRTEWKEIEILLDHIHQGETFLHWGSWHGRFDRVKSGSIARIKWSSSFHLRPKIFPSFPTMCWRRSIIVLRLKQKIQYSRYSSQETTAMEKTCGSGPFI